MLSLIAFPLFFASCTKDNPVPDPANKSNPTGIWKSQYITINGVNSSEYTKGDSTSVYSQEIHNTMHLELAADSGFVRNYVTGTWKVSNDSLILTPDSNHSISGIWNYRILELTETKLKMEIQLTEVQYGYDFKEFEKRRSTHFC